MAKVPAFTCTACGAAHTKWSGRCEACGAWNTIVEEAPPRRRPRREVARRRARRDGRALRRSPTSEPEAPRVASGIGELDRVLGGGLVPASAILVGGDPGIGKSTLLLQAAASLRPRRASSASTSRARRPPPRSACAPPASASPTRPCCSPPRPTCATSSRRSRPRRPALAVIDSIQTIWADNVESAPGSVAQVRAAAHELITFAKRRGMSRRPRRPRHQGRPDRRPPRGRAHGRHRALLRGRARPPVPHPARRQEPLRPGRRDRRLRDDRARASPRSRTPPPCSSPNATRPAAGSVVFAGIEGTRPVLVRDPGPRRPRPRGTGPPLRRRLGRRAARHDPRRARSPLRHRLRGPGRLPERGRRPAHQRARRRPRCGRRATFLARRQGLARRDCRFRRNQSIWRGAPGRADGTAAQGSARSWVSPRP